MKETLLWSRSGWRSPSLPMCWLTHSHSPRQEAGPACPGWPVPAASPAKPCRGPAARRHREQSEEIKAISRPKEQTLVRAQGRPLLSLNRADNKREESSKCQDLTPGANDRTFVGVED